jgi:aspartate aminotransferase-like enzyme
LGLDPFCREEVRSNTVLSIRYPSGIEDVKFRKLLAERFRVLVAGGFGELKGPTFRVGCMGEVEEYHAVTTLNAIASALLLFGHGSPTALQRALQQLPVQQRF